MKLLYTIYEACKEGLVTEHEYVTGQFRPYSQVMLVHSDDLTDESSIKATFVEYRLFEVKMADGKTKHFYFLKDFIENLNNAQVCRFLDEYDYLNKDWVNGTGACEC
jgi:hypothetical protein